MTDERGDEINYPAEPLEQVRFWVQYEQRLDGYISDAIDAARAQGSTWMEIGAALGLTPEGARIRQHRRALREVASEVEGGGRGRGARPAPGGQPERSGGRQPPTGSRAETKAAVNVGG